MGAVGYPLIRVCSEAPWIMGTIRVTAVVLSEVSITHTQATIYMMVLMTVVFTAVSLVSLFLWAF